MYKDQVLIPDVHIFIPRHISPNNNVYENFIILMKQLHSQSIIILYKNPIIKGLLQGHDLDYQSLRAFNNAKRKSNVVMTTKSFLGCGLEYSFDNLIILDEVSERIEDKLTSIFHPTNLWILSES